MSVRFEFNQNNQALTIFVHGQFNFSLVSEFRQIYNEVSSPKTITVDLSETEVVDSSGLGILLYMMKYYHCDKSNVRLLNANHNVSKTLHMAQFGKMFSLV